MASLRHFTVRRMRAGLDADEPILLHGRLIRRAMGTSSAWQEGERRGKHQAGRTALFLRLQAFAARQRRTRPSRALIRKRSCGLRRESTLFVTLIERTFFEADTKQAPSSRRRLQGWSGIPDELIPAGHPVGITMIEVQPPPRLQRRGNFHLCFGHVVRAVPGRSQGFLSDPAWLYVLVRSSAAAWRAWRRYGSS
ncbi:hypothetical protein DES52_11632 [Deinococcus yavapaiensis KR-236]|uniref:Uncharacterized protein n=1 Tax=Deinococcus yavapaiensis KR-236 TaxID=694435 RepID=A0A318S0W8_9DEIO|nr:hypothetical protein DES52_11632 [Deinococcus yavapaiensis KR-236]